MYLKCVTIALCYSLQFMWENWQIPLRKILPIYRLSEIECTYFKQFYWKTTGTEFSPHVRGTLKSFTYEISSVELIWLCAWFNFRAFRYWKDILRSNMSSCRSTVKCRKTGEESSLTDKCCENFNVPARLSQQHCLKCENTFLRSP